jgi:hypothetical protein
MQLDIISKDTIILYPFGYSQTAFCVAQVTAIKRYY